MNNNKKRKNRNRLIDTENRLTAVRWEGDGGWVKRVKGLGKNKNPHRQR